MRDMAHPLDVGPGVYGLTGATTAVAMFAAVLVTFPMMVALLRWPGRTVGFAAALLAYVVAGPLATVPVIGTTAAGAYARHRCESNRRVRARRLLPFRASLGSHPTDANHEAPTSLIPAAA